jgi:1-acyl-sn-glycerol-3-phosphate acyltransferase
MIRKVWYNLGKFIVSLVAMAGFDLDILWKAPLPKGPVILAANHPCTFDPALLTTLFEQHVSILIHGPIFTLPLFGRSLRYCGHIEVLRGTGGKALEKAEELLKAGKTVAIFPEGAISPSGGFHDARSGIGRLALRSGVPVVPVGIHLDSSLLHRVEQHIDGVWDTGAYYFHGPYSMTVGEAQQYQGDIEDRDLVRSISNQVMNSIIDLSLESAYRIRVYRASRLRWWLATRWWMYAPIRLIRSWGTIVHARIR